MCDTTQLHEHLQLGNAHHLCLTGWSGSGLAGLDLFGQLGHFAVLTQRGGAGREGTGFLCLWGRFCFGCSMVPLCPKQSWFGVGCWGTACTVCLRSINLAVGSSYSQWGRGEGVAARGIDSSRHRVGVIFKIKLLTAVEVISLSSLSPP